MIERKKQDIWNIRDSESELIGWATVEDGDLTANGKDIDTLEEYKEFHQALGEAIQIAEAQNNE